MKQEKVWVFWLPHNIGYADVSVRRNKPATRACCGLQKRAWQQGGTDK